MKFIYPDMKTIPSDAERVTIHAVVEDSLADAWLALIGETPWKIIVEPADSFDFDCGGAVRIGEPEMKLELDGWKFTVLVRHAEVLPQFLRKPKTKPEALGPHFFLPGYWVKAVLSVETGRKIADWLDAELPARIAESDQLWARHQESMAKAGAYCPPRADVKSH